MANELTPQELNKNDNSVSEKAKVVDKFETENVSLDTLPPYVKVPELIGYIKERFNFTITDREIVNLGKRKSALVRIGGEIGLRKALILSELENLFGNLTEKYTLASDSKRKAQIRTGIVRKYLEKQAVLNLTVDTAEEGEPATLENLKEARGQRLQTMFTKVNAEIGIKNLELQTKHEADMGLTGTYSPIPLFVSVIELEQFLNTKIDTF